MLDNLELSESTPNVEIPLNEDGTVNEVELNNAYDMVARDLEEAVGYFTKKVGLISPDLGFFVNREALEDNKFINREYIDMSEEETTHQAQVAFDNYVKNLKDNGVGVEVFHQSTKAADSIFPDWFTTARNPTLPNGVLIISAMKNNERRKERMPETLEELFKRYEDVIDLSKFEADGKFLELKGALVTDWENGKIYCNISDRAHEEVFDYMIDELNTIAAKTSDKRIKGVKFRAFDSEGENIYHTDCMFTLFSKHAVICLDAIKDKEEYERIVSEITSQDINVNPKEIINISFEESANMCANMFNVLDSNNNHCVVMSKRANEHFEESNLDTIYGNYKVIVADIDIVENIGGGSARCMLVELF